MEDLTNKKRKRAPVNRGTTPLETLGQQWGISRERVRQIEQRALGKLKRALRKRGFKAEDFF